MSLAQAFFRKSVSGRNLYYVWDNSPKGYSQIAKHKIPEELLPDIPEYDPKFDLMTLLRDQKTYNLQKQKLLQTLKDLEEKLAKLDQQIQSTGIDPEQANEEVQKKRDLAQQVWEKYGQPSGPKPGFDQWFRHQSEPSSTNRPGSSQSTSQSHQSSSSGSQSQHASSSGSQSRQSSFSESGSHQSSFSGPSGSRQSSSSGSRESNWSRSRQSSGTNQSNSSDYRSRAQILRDQQEQEWLTLLTDQKIITGIPPKLLVPTHRLSLMSWIKNGSKSKEFKTNFRKWMVRNHPDRGGDLEVCAKVNAAATALLC